MIRSAVFLIIFFIGLAGGSVRADSSCHLYSDAELAERFDLTQKSFDGIMNQLQGRILYSTSYINPYDENALDHLDVMMLVRLGIFMDALKRLDALDLSAKNDRVRELEVVKARRVLFALERKLEIIELGKISAGTSKEIKTLRKLIRGFDSLSIGLLGHYVCQQKSSFASNGSEGSARLACAEKDKPLSAPSGILNALAQPLNGQSAR